MSGTAMPGHMLKVLPGSCRSARTARRRSDDAVVARQQAGGVQVEQAGQQLAPCRCDTRTPTTSCSSLTCPADPGVLEWVGGTAAVLDRDPALLGERLDAGRAAEFAVTRVLHAAEGGHGLIGDALIVDVDYP
jgi:hypothetical protein